MHLLDDASDKLELGKARLEELYVELLDALDPKQHPVRADLHTYPYPKPPGTIDPREWLAWSIVVTEVPRFDSQVGMHIGEVLHHFRGCLDHIAWALIGPSGRKGLNDDQLRAIAFPLTNSPGSYRYWKGRRLPGLPGVRDDLLELIEAYQPYRRSVAGRAMRNLRDLSDIDKHRTILPAVVLPQSANLNVKYEGAELIDHWRDLKFGREAKKGTKLFTFVLAGGEPGERKVGVEGMIYSQPMFRRSLVRPAPGDDAPSVERTLNDIRRACQCVLTEIWDKL